MKTRSIKLAYVLVFGLSSIIFGCGHSGGGSSGVTRGSPATATTSPATIAALEAAAGSYSGPLVSKQNGATVGTLQLTLQNAQNGNTASAILIFTSADRPGGSNFSSGFVLQPLFFNTKSQQITAQHTVKFSGQDVQINFVSTLDNSNSLTGTLQIAGSETFGADFNLVRSQDGATAPAPITSSSPTNLPLQTPATLAPKFTGTVFQANSKSQGATLALEAGSLTSDEKFVSLLSPLKEYKMLLSYEDGTKVNLSNLTWDQSLNTAYSAKAAGSPALTCSLANASGANSAQMTCTLTESDGATKTKLILSQASAPVSTSILNQGAPTPVSGKIFTYNGTAQFIDSGNKKMNRSVTLQVAQLVSPSDASMKTRNLQLTFLVQPSKVGAEFQNATWNTDTGDVEARQNLAIGTTNGEVNFVCAQFALIQKPYDFTCRYTSTIGDVHASIHFTGK